MSAAETLKTRPHVSLARFKMITSLLLTDGEKEIVLDILEKYQEGYDKSRDFRSQYLRYQTIAGICGAIVPVLIPFGQTYQDTEWEFHGYTFNLGTFIAVFAVFCSLIASIVRSLEAGYKSKEQAALYNAEADRVDQEIQLFLSMAGHYEPFTADHSKAFKLFMVNYTTIRTETSRSQLFDDGASGSAGGGSKSAEEPAKK